MDVGVVIAFMMSINASTRSSVNCAIVSGILQKNCEAKEYTDNNVVVLDQCENLIHNHEPYFRTDISRQIVNNAYRKSRLYSYIVILVTEQKKNVGIILKSL